MIGRSASEATASSTWEPTIGDLHQRDVTQFVVRLLQVAADYDKFMKLPI